MEKGYFAASWEDIRNSQGWVGKVFLLALISLIPIFGAIVVYGYLYGWTREMAWNIHRPLPARIFGNEDGLLYRRGGYMFLLTLIVALIAGLLSSFSGGGTVGAVQDLQSLQSGGSVYNDTVNIMYSPLAGFASLLSLVFAVFAVFWTMIAFGRICIYNTFGSAFNFKQIWAMFRYDGFGLLRIFGIVLLIGLIGGIAASVLLVPAFMFVFASIFQAASYGSGADFLAPTANLGIGVALLILGLFVAQLFSVFADMIQARCVGYWLRQFDVAQWGGPEDLLPFQRMGYTSADQVRNLQQQQAWGYGQQPTYGTQQPPMYGAQESPTYAAEQPMTSSYPGQGYQQPATADPIPESRPLDPQPASDEVAVDDAQAVDEEPQAGETRGSAGE